ncbi:MAG TPA: autotransporter outer membrane beta-barrel domain-containing protein, partial [Sphingomonadales bacterium]
IYALNEGLGSVTVTASGGIQTAGAVSHGITAVNSNALATGDVRLIQTGGFVTTNGSGAAGIFIKHEGQGDVSGDIAGTIHTLGPASDGVYAAHYAAGAANSVTVTIRDSGSILTRGDSSYGLWVDQFADGDATAYHAGTIETFGEQSVGIRLLNRAGLTGGAALLELSGDASIVTHGTEALGVRVTGPHDATVRLLGASSVTTLGDKAAAIFVGSTAGPAEVIQESGASVAASGRESYGIETEGPGGVTLDLAGQVAATGEFSVAVSALSGGDVTLALAPTARVTGGWQATKDATGPTLGAPAAGLLLDSAGVSRVDNAGAIGAASDRAIANARYGSASGGAIVVENSGTITGFVEFSAAPGNSFTNAADGILALRHFADSDGDGIRDVKRVAIADFGASDSVFHNAGTVRLGAVTGAGLATDDTGYYLPTTGSDRRAMDAGFYDLARSGVTQAQMVNLGVFNHAGVIDLRGDAVGNSLVITGNAVADGTAGGGVFVSDGGRLYLNAVLNAGGADSRADMLIVDATQLGAAATTVFVSYEPDDLGDLTAGNGIQLVEVLDKGASAADVFVLGNIVAAGAFEYTLHHNGVGDDAADGNWYLRSTRVVTPQPDPAPSPAPDLDPDPNPDPDPAPEVPAFRREVATYVTVPALAHRFGLEMLGTFHDRAGENYSVASPGQGIIWGRVFGFDGEFGDSGGGVAAQYDRFVKRGAAYDHRTLGMQMGLDLHRRTSASGARSVAGFYVGAGETRASVEAVYGGRSGRAELVGYSLGGYWVRTGGDGSYVDLVIQGTRYEGDLDMPLRDGFSPEGWAFTGSVEGGRPLALGGSWVFEPQAQLVVQHVDLSGGRDSVSRVGYDADTAFFGRLGARLVRTWLAAGDRPVTLSGRFNVWHDFDQGATTRIATPNGGHAVDLRASLGGTWGQAQVMAASQITASLSASRWTGRTPKVSAAAWASAFASRPA